MAKPVITIPAIWASDTLYSVGSYAGKTTKDTAGAAVYARGWYPGPEFPPAANEDNFYWNLVAQYTKWANDDGTDASVELESIVERNSLGYTALRRLTIDAATATGAGLTVTGGGGSGIGIVAHGAGANSAIEARSHGTVAAITALGDGTGPAGDGVGIDATGAGSRQGGIMRGGANADGLQALGTGTGDGVKAFGGTTSGAAYVGTGGAPDGIGGALLGTGAGRGLTATGGATGKGAVITGGATSGDGLQVFAVGAANTAIEALTAAAATTLAAAVKAQGRGDGVGLLAQAGDGHCLLLSPTTSTRAEMRFGGRTSDPSTPSTEGDMWLNTLTDDKFKGRLQSSTVYFQTATKALVSGFEQDSGDTGGATAVVNIGSAFGFIDIPNEIIDIIFIVTIAFDVTIVGDILPSHVHLFKIRDQTLGSEIFSQGVSIPHVGSGIANYYKIELPYLLPAAGQRSFQMQFKLSGSSSVGQVDWSRATCRIVAKPV